MVRLKTTKKGRRLIIVGLVSYTVFLLTTLPASFLTRYILPSIANANEVKLQSVHGSLWQGQANDARVGSFNLGQLKWDFSAWGLLLGNIDLDLKFKNENAKGNADVSLGFGGSTSASDVDVDFPAEMLQPLFYGFPVSIAGELRGRFSEFNYKQNEVLQADGRMIWQGAALRAPQNIELGDFSIDLARHNTGTKIKITDENEGPVKAEINIKIDGTGKYNLNGWMQARDESQQHITEALRFIGARPDNSGRYWVTYNGRFSQPSTRGSRVVR